MGRGIGDFEKTFEKISGFARDEDHFALDDAKGVIGEAGKEFFQAHPGFEQIMKYMIENQISVEAMDGLLVSLGVAAAQPSPVQADLLQTISVALHIFSPVMVNNPEPRNTISFAFQKTANTYGEQSLYDKFPDQSALLDLLLTQQVEFPPKPEFMKYGLTRHDDSPSP